MVGVALERGVIRHLYGRPLETLLATWGISLGLIQTVRLIFGAQNVAVANPDWLAGGVRDRARPGAALEPHRASSASWSLVAAGVWFILQQTRFGLQVRAVTQNRGMASCLGIRTKRVDALVFGLGSGIAGLGGVALSQLGNVGPELGQSYIIDSFMVVVLGGVGRLAGAVAAALGLGHHQQADRAGGGRGAREDRRAGASSSCSSSGARRGCSRCKRSGGGVMSVLASRLREMHSPRVWAVVGGVGGAAWRCCRSSGCRPHLVPLFGKFLCFGIAALAMDLVWGYAGILSLGHGLFFALGGYGMGMYLMRSIAGEGVYRSALPDFMVFLDWKELPWYWHGFEHFGFAAAMALAGAGRAGAGVRVVRVPVAHPRRLLLDRHAGADLRGDAAVLPERHRVRRQQRPDRLQAHPGRAAARSRRRARRCTWCRRSRWSATYVLCRYVVTSRLGRVLTAVRDAELKTRFCGYESTHYKLFVWTLSAMLCGAGGRALRAAGRDHQPQRDAALELDRDGDLGGGRRARVAGRRRDRRLIVAGGKSWLTDTIPSAWLYVLGALFVVVTLFLPRGRGRPRSQAAARPRRRCSGEGRGSRCERDPPVTDRRPRRMETTA